MIKVVLLGSGNVAIQLAKAFLKSDKVDLLQVYSRKKKPNFFKKKGIDITHDVKTLKNAAVYIIAISDDHISNFSKQLVLKDKLVVHTSGSVAMQDLQCLARKGIFYPLQTISKDKKLNFKKVPICLETEFKEDYLVLEELAKSISNNVYKIDSKQRKNLHVAAVFVNNFVNHLYTIGNEICKDKEVPFDILKPLIYETAKKIKYLKPKEAQTGPAKRNDEKTMENHLTLLSKEQQKIYKLLSDSIKKEHL